MTSERVGKSVNSKCFEDYHLFDESLLEVKLQEITVYYDHEYVYGMKAKWTGNNKIITGGRHLDKKVNKSKLQKTKIYLKPEEYIVKIWGAFDHHIIRLCLETNTKTNYI